MKEILYDAIFKRRSIRNYDSSALDKETIKSVSNFLENLNPIYGDIKTEFKIISSGDVNKRMMRQAPYYIAAFSENKEGYLTNIGFIFQQVDLYLSANGIGCCWQGIPKPKGDILKGSKLEYVIVLAFGKPNEALYRENISEFKRKDIHKISDINGLEELLEPARLAPSATNSQPWFFKGDENSIHAYCIKPNFLKALIVKKWNHIDMGIALCHLKLAAEHFGLNSEIIKNKQAEENTPDGYEYIATLKINS